MKIFSEIKPGLMKESSAAVGFFDGVHRGHQKVIGQGVQKAWQNDIPAVLVTFKDHPKTRVLGKSPPLLTVVEQRLALFERLKVDVTLMLDFTEEICRLSPVDYVQQVLVECLGVKHVAIGYNHTFGRNREGNPELLKKIGAGPGKFATHVVDPVHVDGMEVSSSTIRQAVEAGDLELAARLLSRYYSVRGTVSRGDGRGRQIGFPTANLAYSEIQLLPALGVYAGMVRLSDGRNLPAVINLGYRPTVTAGDKLCVEAHLLDFSEDLYGHTVEIEFWKRLRAETKFDSVEALSKQIAADCLSARAHLESAVGLTNSGEWLPA